MDLHLKKTLDQLQEYSKQVIAKSNIDENTYWIRKSKKLVLAMVAIKHQNEWHYLPGNNIEVSIAAGTICAERNAIGACFTKYPNIKKKDIICMAVARFDLKEKKLVYIKPCCLCISWLHKIWGNSWPDRVISVEK